MTFLKKPEITAQEITDIVQAYGTSEGVRKSWLKRQRALPKITEIQRGRNPEDAAVEADGLGGEVQIDENCRWHYRFRPEWGDAPKGATVTPNQIDGEYERRAIEACVQASREFWSDPSREAMVIRRGDRVWEKAVEGALTAKIYVSTIYTMNTKDYGAGSGGTGSAKIFWGPYSCADRDARLTTANNYCMANSSDVDPIYVASHEIHHALGYDSEIDLSSEVVAISAHCKTGLNYNTKAAMDQVGGWLASARFSSCKRATKYKNALRYIDKKHPAELATLAISARGFDSAEQWEAWRKYHLYGQGEKVF